MNIKIVLCFIFTISISNAHFIPSDVKYADKNLLNKQKQLFEIFRPTHQIELEKEHNQIAKEFKLKEHIEDYTKENVVQNFLSIYNDGVLKEVDGEIFSITIPRHLEEAKALFELLYYAKDWDTFFKTAIWASNEFQADLFEYSISLAVLHRKDCEGLILPPVYEFNPFYFHPSDLLQKVIQQKIHGFDDVEKVNGIHTVYFYSNYSKWFEQLTKESKLSYFTEDLGLNSYYYYFHMDYPYWMNGEEYHLNKDRRGEYYMYQYQQFLARYYLERLSNHMGEIKDFSFYETIDEGYYPNLHYFNGLSFPSRDSHFIPAKNYELINMVEVFESRIHEAVDKGFFYTKDKRKIELTDPSAVEYLGNLMQGNDDSLNPNFYGFWELNAKRILSPTITFNNDELIIPGVLEHFETAMREPLFYMFYKRFVNIYKIFKSHLKNYTHDDIKFENVKINNAHVDKLTTYFEWFDSDLSIAVYNEKDRLQTKFMANSWHGEEFIIYGRSKRINHKPFTVNLTVTSDISQKAVIKYFIGPKYDIHGNIYNYEDNRENWYEIDQYVVDLVAGENFLTRKSTEFSWFVNDRTTYSKLYKEIMMASENDEHKFPLDMSEAHCGFPRRLMLPKGTESGMTFQMLFYIYPYHAPKVEQFSGYDERISCGVGSGSRFIDDTPFGFPFDRKFDYKHKHLPENMYFYDVKIYHNSQL